MAVKRRILTFFLVLAITISIACSNSSSSNSSSKGQASVSIALNPKPTSTNVPVGSATGIQFTPVVSNDPANSGVDWALTCALTAPGACGTLNISTFHSASGTAVTYIPPTSLFSGTLSVNVTAFATADHTKNVTTAVTVTSYANVLNGTYVLQIQGTGGDSFPYQSTGAFVFDGNGNITSGQQTLNTGTGFSTTYTVEVSSVAASTYFVGPDGRGSLTLNLQQTGTGASNLETFSFTVLSIAGAQVAEFDSNTGSGTLELQDQTVAATMPTGAYAFVTQGTDSGNQNPNNPGFPQPTAFGGVFNIDNSPSTGSISGNGSLADQDYYNPTFSARKLLSCVPPTGVTGTVSQPVAPGIVTITLTGATCFGQTQPATIQFTGYIVDATHIRLIESDDLAGTSGFLTAGIAVSQGSAAGTFTNASLMGPYVFGVLGYDINSGNVPASFTSAGVVNADGIGTLTGINDTLFQVDFAAFTTNTLTGTYATDTTLLGRVDLSAKFQGPAPKPKVALLFYLTGNGTPPLILWSEGGDLNFPAVGTGIAYPQAANASTLAFGNPETYGFGLTQNNGSEIAASGEMFTTINGVAGSIMGQIEDFNSNDFNGGGAVPLIDTFTLPADSFGRISGTFRNQSGGMGPFFEYYMVDDNHGFMEETDLVSLSSGQVSLGYFSQACDVTNAASCAAAASHSSARAQRKPGSRSSRGNSNIAVH